jgi:hypothetical protein
MLQPQRDDRLKANADSVGVDVGGGASQDATLSEATQAMVG